MVSLTNHKSIPFFTVAFRIYDMDCDGYISNGELYQVCKVVGKFPPIATVADGLVTVTTQVLKMMVGNNLKEAQLQQIVDKTIMYSDHDGDGKISFDEFVQVIGHTDVEEKMVVEF